MKASTFKSDDGQTIFEWISPDARFGLWFEGKCASWFYAAKPTDAGDCAGEELSRPMLEDLRDTIDAYLRGAAK